MRFLSIALAFAASLGLFYSCTNEADDVVANDVKVEKTFGVNSAKSGSRAHIEGFSSTSSTVAVYWDNTDKVTVLAKGHTFGDEFSFKTIGSNNSIATFTGKTYNADEYYVISPAQPSAKLTSNGYVEFNIPNRQKAINGTFDPAAGIQVGAAGGSDIDLKSVCAYFYLTVGEKCNGISIEAKNSEWHLAGTVAAEVHSSGNTIKEFRGDCTNKIELTDIPEEGGTFFIAFIPSKNVKSDLNVKVSYPQNVSGLYNVDLEAKEDFQFVSNAYYNLGNFGHKSN